MEAFKDQVILIISPEPWEASFVSKHHYAIALAHRGNQVYFLNPPKHAIQQDIAIQSTVYKDLYVIDYKPIGRGLQYLPAFLRNAVERRFLHRLQQLVNRAFNVIWNFENSRFYDFRFAGKAFKIYHQVDLNQNFHISTAAATADVCFCTTDFIAAKLSPYSRNVFKIHHGVAEHAFNSTEVSSISSTGKGRPVALYIGNLDIQYLDLDLLEQLVISNSDVQFQFVGGYSMEKPAYQRLSVFSNVILTGPVASKDLQGYLKNSDVLLVCYKAEEYREQLASPHKMMEYLASGKTIVATYTDEYKDKQELLVMAECKEKFLEAFGLVVNNLSFYNSTDMQAKRIEYAKQHIYPFQLNKVIKQIEQLKHG